MNKKSVKMRRRRRIIRIVKIYLFWCVLCLVVFGIYEQYKAKKNNTVLVYRNGSGISGNETKERKSRDIAVMDRKVREIHDTRQLYLVNADYALKDEVSAHMVSGYHAVALAKADISMDSSVLQAAKALFAEARKSGYTDFFVSSGYRSAKRQKAIYEEANDKNYVQKANHSEHQLGLALDIAYTGIDMYALGKTQQGKWLRDNAWKYGFLIRYEESKQDITGIKGEPWHLRYVGIPHAYFCYEQNFCMEEYIAYLKEHESYSISVNGTDYTVYRFVPTHDILKVPAEGNYEISGDNAGGFIITLKE